MREEPSGEQYEEVISPRVTDDEFRESIIVTDFVSIFRDDQEHLSVIEQDPEE